MEKNKEDIIDFGSVTVPTKWEDLTLKQYQELTKYYADKEKKFDAREVIHILCNKTVDEVNALPLEFTEKIMEKLLFLKEEPKIGEPTIELTVNGEKYHINVMEKMKTGEYLQAQSVLQSDQYNFAAMLAILCRKDGEIYDSKFEAEMFEKRVGLFEKVPMLDAMRVINFFIQCYITLQAPSQLSSQIKEAISLIRMDIENSAQNGHIGKLSTKSVVKKLRKLEKITNSI